MSEAEENGHAESDDAAAGDRAEDVLSYIVTSLVDYPDDIAITPVDGDEGGTVLQLQVNSDDMGKVIGKRGRTANAIRTMIKAATSGEDSPTTVDIVE